MLQFIVAGVFTVSAASKLRAGEARTQFVYAVDALGFGKPSLVARGVTLFEVLVAAACLVPGAANVGLSGALLATSGFTAVIVYAMRHGVRVQCPCFGPSGMPLGPVHVIRNLVIAGIASAALVLNTQAHGSPPIGDRIAGLAVGVVFVFIIATFDTLLALPGGTGGVNAQGKAKVN